MTEATAGRTLDEVTNLGHADTDAAMVAAKKAWPAWRRKTAKQRGAILMN